jgi:hypothetical protein
MGIISLRDVWITYKTEHQASPLGGMGPAPYILSRGHKYIYNHIYNIYIHIYIIIITIIIIVIIYNIYI